MKKYFVKKDGKFLNTVLEFDAKAYPAEKKAEEWVAHEQRKNPGSKYELFSWDGWMNVEVAKKLEENGFLPTQKQYYYKILMPEDRREEYRRRIHGGEAINFRDRY